MRPEGTTGLEGGPEAKRRGGQTAAELYEWRGTTVAGRDTGREKHFPRVWLQVPPCSVALLKHTITQSRAIIWIRGKRERDRVRQRVNSFWRMLHSWANECFYQSCDYCHSLHALNQPTYRFFLFALCHSLSAASVWVDEIIGFTNENRAVEPQQFKGKHLCYVVIPAGYFWEAKMGRWCGSRSETKVLCWCH